MGELRRAGLGSEYRILATGEAISVLGDQLAKVGIAFYVYRATGSAAPAALAFAATFLPDLVAGPLLSPLADRFARRPVMVTCLLLQAACAAALAIPSLPVGLVIIGVVGIAAASAPFKAAQAVTVNDVLPTDEQRMAGRRWLFMMREAGQLAGIGTATAIVAAVGPSMALIIDAASFLAVALLIQLGVRLRPPAQHTAGGRDRLGWQLVWRDHHLRVLNVLVLVGTLAILPEAVIVPLLAEMPAPTGALGLLLGANVVGYLLGTLLLGRASPQRQSSLVGLLLLLSLAPLAGFALRPGPAWATVLMLLSGAGAAYLSIVQTVALSLASDQVRARVAGWLRTGLRAGQGLAVLAGGLLADVLGSPSLAVAVAGMAGTAAAAACLVPWARSPTIRYGVT
ncbi:MFS transporter [Amycolatopsis anabasis]|uniref:MFS transporter n=1 Tax=Amycolatopsis anabasis TaxID=1840409 RepID=UPI00131D60D6|nr:MFS transporter [Amycolatopsis anabasis]